MKARLYFTVIAVLGIVYGLAFVFVPTTMGAIYGVAPNPEAALNSQFFGSALIWLAVISWFAREFRDWDAIRGLLIAAVVGCVVGGGVNLVGTFAGLLNGMAWTSTLLYVVLIVWALYCLSTGPETSGTSAKAAQ
jgi:hypothetical protein